MNFQRLNLPPIREREATTAGIQADYIPLVGRGGWGEVDNRPGWDTRLCLGGIPRVGERTQQNRPGTQSSSWPSCSQRGDKEHTPVYFGTLKSRRHVHTLITFWKPNFVSYNTQFSITVNGLTHNDGWKAQGRQRERHTQGQLKKTQLESGRRQNKNKRNTNRRWLFFKNPSPPPWD